MLVNREKELEIILNKFPLFHKLNSIPLLDNLLLDYLNDISKKAGKEFNQGEAIKKMIGKKDLVSQSTIFHEKAEISAYLSMLKNGKLIYTPEDVRNGTAHKNDYKNAHDFAKKEEFKLLNHILVNDFEIPVPDYVLLSSRPQLGMFKCYDEINCWFSKHLDNSLELVCLGKEKFNLIAIDKEDFKKVFKMFEKYGNKTSSKFKKKVIYEAKKSAYEINEQYSKFNKDFQRIHS